jgi:hypothetical protein
MIRIVRKAVGKASNGEAKESYQPVGGSSGLAAASKIFRHCRLCELQQGKTPIRLQAAVSARLHEKIQVRDRPAEAGRDAED